MDNERDLNRLLHYLEDHCGGRDRHEFVDAHGQPDLAAARVFAESMRERFRPWIGEFLDIEQSVNVVRVTQLAMAGSCV